jgi:hypothetical protein
LVVANFAEDFPPSGPEQQFFHLWDLYLVDDASVVEDGDASDHRGAAPDHLTFFVRAILEMSVRIKVTYLLLSLGSVLRSYLSDEIWFRELSPEKNSSSYDLTSFFPKMTCCAFSRTDLCSIKYSYSASIFLRVSCCDKMKVCLVVTSLSI